MNKPLLLLLSMLITLLLVSCGGGSGGSSGGSSSGGNSPSSKVLLDRTNTYPALNEKIIEHLRITEKHQNNNQENSFTLWNYRYSPTNIERTITFESYETNSFVSNTFYEKLSGEDIYEYSPRPIVKSLNNRKLTQIYYTGGKSYLGGITYNSKTAFVFDNSRPPQLVDFKIKREPELISAGLQKGNRDFCSDDFSTGEISFSATSNAFWQVGDSYEVQSDVSGPVISCDSQGNSSIAGHYANATSSIDTFIGHHTVFSLRGRDFHNVIEFNNLQTTRTRASGKIVSQELTKTYLQFYTGRIAESNTSCLGGAIGDDKAICSTTDEVATNVPTIPEI